MHWCYKNNSSPQTQNSYVYTGPQKCHFSCNMVNGSLFLPPVMLRSINQVSCANCTVDSECPGKMQCASATVHQNLKSTASENIHAPLAEGIEIS